MTKMGWQPPEQRWVKGVGDGYIKLHDVLRQFSTTADGMGVPVWEQGCLLVAAGASGLVRHEGRECAVNVLRGLADDIEAGLPIRED